MLILRVKGSIEHTHNVIIGGLFREYNTHTTVIIGDLFVQDEYVTAAFKTAELGAYLNENPTQYREVEGHESDLFLSYFPEGIK